MQDIALLKWARDELSSHIGDLQGLIDGSASRWGVQMGDIHFVRQFHQVIDDLFQNYQPGSQVSWRLTCRNLCEEKLLQSFLLFLETNQVGVDETELSMYP
jgi:hypothetical protein